jgi:hypothetical protein
MPRIVNPFLLMPELPARDLAQQMRRQANDFNETVLDQQLADAADLDLSLDADLADMLNLRDG